MVASESNARAFRGPDGALMTDLLDASYAYCRDLTRRTAGNFGYSFWALPAEQHRGMDALYAFLRLTDDVGDDPNLHVDLRRLALTKWREDFEAALKGQHPEHPVWPAVLDMIQRFDIPVQHLSAVIEGVERDLSPCRMQTFAELSDYCYHVAGAVGLCCIRVWGCRDAAAEPWAIDCGLGFQLTNILRDLAEDAALGRVYLPEDDLVQFGYSRDCLQTRTVNREFRLLMAFEVERAKAYYQRALKLKDYLPPPGRRVLRIMQEIYGGLLSEIERRDFDVFSRRVRLPGWKKCWITARAMLS